MPSESRDTVTLTETDEVGNPTATYIYSESSSSLKSSTSDGDVKQRIDVASPPLSPSSSLLGCLIDVFLPAGYPHSVSHDYLRYQIFDSLQAFCSSIAGLLSSRAVLQGVGVGNANASPTSALLLRNLQDTTGRLATIIFAHRVGTAIEPECKTYRLAADVFNDVAMLLDCLSPLAEAGLRRVAVLSAAGVLRALCGVAGGSSKASLSAHFARWGNLAEVNAKDSSQETVVSLVGMLVGSLVVSHVTNPTTTWIALTALLTLHLCMNYAAVRAVHMTSLNRQRANIVFSALFNSDPDLDLDQLKQEQEPEPEQKQGQGEAKAKSRRTNDYETELHILTPAQVASQERIFATGESLTWTHGSNSIVYRYNLGTCRIGGSLRTLFANPNPALTSWFKTASTSMKPPTSFPKLLSLFAAESYLLFVTGVSGHTHTHTDTNTDADTDRDTHTHTQSRTKTKTKPKPKPKTQTSTSISIILKTTSTAQTQLKAWAHALLVARVLYTSCTCTCIHTGDVDHNNKTQSSPDEHTCVPTFRVISRSLDFLNDRDRFGRYLDGLGRVGWEVGLGLGALETRPGRRVRV